MTNLNDKFTSRTVPNVPDYKDNIIFEPKLTWEQLCIYATNNGATEYVNTTAGNSSFEWRNISFFENGEVIYCGCHLELVCEKHPKSLV